MEQRTACGGIRTTRKIRGGISWAEGTAEHVTVDHITWPMQHERLGKRSKIWRKGTTVPSTKKTVLGIDPGGKGGDTGVVFISYSDTQPATLVDSVAVHDGFD